MTDGREWSQWFDRYGPAMLMLARQVVPVRADAEDVVQEAFVRFWRVRERVRSVDPVMYLFQCVRNEARDWRRSRRRRDRRERAVAKPELPRDPEPLFTAGPEREERRLAIEAALVTLPENQREVLVMKVWAKLTFLQIGEAVGVPTDTAASRYRYALAKLREQLAEELIP